MAKSKNAKAQPSVSQITKGKGKKAIEKRVAIPEPNVQATKLNKSVVKTALKKTPANLVKAIPTKGKKKAVEIVKEEESEDEESVNDTEEEDDSESEIKVQATKLNKSVMKKALKQRQTTVDLVEAILAKKKAVEIEEEESEEDEDSEMEVDVEEEDDEEENSLIDNEAEEDGEEEEDDEEEHALIENKEDDEEDEEMDSQVEDEKVAKSEDDDEESDEDVEELPIGKAPIYEEMPVAKKVKSKKEKALPKEESDEDVEELPIGKAPIDEGVPVAKKEKTKKEKAIVEEESETVSLEDIPNAVYVGNCHSGTKRSELIKIFQKFGEIKSIVYNFVEFKGRRVGLKAYIVFKNKSSVEPASKLRYAENRGRMLYVSKVKWTGEPNLADKIIYVANLAPTTSEDDIEQFFSDCGEVALIELINKDPHKSQAFVCFTSPDAVGESLKLHGKQLDGRALFINSRTSKQEIQKKTVFVMNLSEGVSEDNIRAFFASCGELISVQFGKNKRTAIVNFREEESLSKALQLNGTQMEGFEKAVVVKNFVAKDADNNFSISVCNIPSKTKQAEINKFFAQCGDIIYCNVYKALPGKPTTNAIMRFKTKQALQNAIALGNSEFKNHKLSVKELKQKGKANESDPKPNNILTPEEKKMLAQINAKLNQHKKSNGKFVQKTQFKKQKKPTKAQQV